MTTKLGDNKNKYNLKVTFKKKYFHSHFKFFQQGLLIVLWPKKVLGFCFFVVIVYASKIQLCLSNNDQIKCIVCINLCEQIIGQNCFYHIVTSLNVTPTKLMHFFFYIKIKERLFTFHMLSLFLSKLHVIKA